ncbi:MAG: glucosamine-6-phosphate deaminase [Candidatus Nanoarchaeia archaeon]|nr:glucosamine-6-phosphate deaminase [Candidatus Nanoarchaeia archaeon]
MKVIIAKSRKEAVKRAASIFLGAVKRKPHAVLGLATGSTMIPLYRKLVQLYKKGEIDFSKIKTFNLDEYTRSKIFHKYMNKHLFSKVNIKKQNAHFPSSNTKDYENEIKKAGGIDLCILGIGKNGHIAFNEPGSSFQSITRKVITADSRHAYSIGIKTIMSSKKIILLAFGKEKANAVFKSLRGDVTEDVPASVLRKHKDAAFILDKAAASKL